MFAATLVLAVVWWLYALFGRRWRVEPELLCAADSLSPARVVAVVPARNEALELPRTLPALLSQEGVVLEVILVDDHSDDGTAEAARRAAREIGAVDRLAIVSSAPLPQGWTGKVWAQHQGIERALARGAEWVWLTDADIHHHPDVLARLLTTAGARERDLVSVMARLHCANAFEKLLLPAFTYFFAALYSFARTADDRARDAGAAGGCVLVRAPLLARIGGMEKIRNAVIDDVSLAGACKRAGARLWLGYHRGVESTRPYESVWDVWSMVARSAYTQLGYNPWAVAGCVAGLAYLFLVPWAAIILGIGKSDALLFALGAGAYAAMARTYQPLVTHLGCRPVWALALPAAATLYACMTVTSAWRYHFAGGAAWKGRSYA